MVMVPAASVSGRVRNARDRAVGGVPVQLLRATYDFNGERTFVSAGQAVTNDRGEYRIYLVTPGRYVLSAGLDLLAVPETADEQRVSPRRYAPVFYPGVADQDQAVALDLQPGDSRDGMDLKLASSRVAIRGTVVDAAGRPATARVTLNGSFLRASAGRDGMFVLRDIAPGKYSLHASGDRMEGTVSVTVGDADVDGIALEVKPVGAYETSIRGTLAIEGVGAPALDFACCVSVALTGFDGDRHAPGQWGGARMPDGSFKPNGTFVVSNVRHGTYRFTMDLPEGFYVKQAWYGGRDVLNRPFEVDPSVAPDTLNVTIAWKTGSVSGVVSGGALSAESLVALIPESAPQLIRIQNLDGDGRFEFANVPPGDYRVFAWEALEPHAYYDPEVLRSATPFSKSIHVSESSTETVTLTAKPAPQHWLR
jgi:hypothetical protein